MTNIRHSVVGVDPGLKNTGIAALHRMVDGTIVPAGVRMSLAVKDTSKKHVRVTSDNERRIQEHYRAIADVMQIINPAAVGVESYTIYDDHSVAKLKSAASDMLALFGLAGRQNTMPPTAEVFLAALEKPDLFAKFVGGLILMRAAVKNEASFMGTRGRGAAAYTMAVYGASLAAAYARNVPVFAFAPVDLKTRVCGRKSASKQDVADALCIKIVGLQDSVESTVKAKTKHEHVYDAYGHAYLTLETYETFLSNVGAY